MADRERTLRLAAEIISAHATNNAVPSAPASTRTHPASVQFARHRRAEETAEPAKPDPAVPIGQSVRAAHVVCLECGKQFSMIKRHLTTDHQLTPEQYRRRWGLPASYPLVAPNYAKVRSALAKKDRAQAEGYGCKEEPWTRASIVRGKSGYSLGGARARIAVLFTVPASPD